MSPHKKQNTPIEALSLKFTAWVGTPTSIVAHTFFFIGIFFLQLLGFTIDNILLILTTVVSLEAIYLAIFIQMSINRNTESLEAVEEDIGEVSKDIDELQEDVEEIAKDVDEIQEDVEDIEEDVDEIAKDVDEIQEDEEEEIKQKQLFEKVESQLEIIMKEIQELKKKQK